MNQPQLGLKVSELRQQKGLTQEQLAERCEVSSRTIQRIESGEVDPRAYTLHCLGEALEFDFGADDTSSENVWLTLTASQQYSLPSSSSPCSPGRGRKTSPTRSTSRAARCSTSRSP